MDWLFQFNPTRFDLAAFLDGGGTREDWNMKQGRNFISPGDRVFFWQTGKEAQLLATGRVISPVYEREGSEFGRYWVDIAFEQRIVPPLRKDEVLANETLRNFAPFKGAMGTNFLIQDPAVIADLEKMVTRRLLAIHESTPREILTLAQDIDAIKKAEDAIRYAKIETLKTLRNHISKMDPFDFEYLARAVFLKLGYKDVVVTKQSGDAGIDVKAVLKAGGVENIKTCIQVKRQTSVGRPTIQNIRGSLGPHERGIVVTSGSFTEGACKDAADPTRAPITLINGQNFAELLAQCQIGITHVDRKLYRLALDDLASDKLQAFVEESGGGES